MDDESVSTFCSFTSATPEQAQQYLRLTDGNVEQAVELYFSDPGLGNTSQPAQSSRDNPIPIDDDDEVVDDDDEVQEISSRQVPQPDANYEDDEALARRLQEEMYGGGGRAAAAEEEDVRAPIARTAQTLVGGDDDYDWRGDPGQMNAAIAQQLMNRQQRRRAQPGIFNQRESASIWANNNPSDPQAHARALSRATGGASDQSSKSNLLADLFRPPFDLISQLPFSTAREEGKETEKWILVNVQDPAIFDCQVLNRDIWKNEGIRETVKEHFIFLQYQKDDPRGQEYMNYYFSSKRDDEDAYPHIAIVDPRTGEQVKTWSGSPAPRALEFLSELHEFLDRYSLNMAKKNPVQSMRKEKQKEVTQMTEDEMLQMALNASMNQGSSRAKDVDPDSLTKPPDSSSASDTGPDMMDVADVDDSSVETPFAAISSSAPHEEPAAADPKTVTRIQFRYSGGRVVRRFAVSDAVRRIYEWLKASPVEGHEGKSFELIAMGKNLIDSLDTTIDAAGLKNGTVMVEFTDDS